MILRPAILIALGIVVLGWGSVLGGQGDFKQIRLRHGAITTPPRGVSGKATVSVAGGGAAQGQARAGGLLLIQLETAPGAGEREVLEGLGVRLLSYLPDDAYVARLNGVSLEAVSRLPFVRWVGDYRPEFKTDRRFARRMRGQGVDDELEASVLLAPGVDEAGRGTVRQSFRQVVQEARGRFGSVIRGRVPRGRLELLAQSDSVLWIEPMGRMRMSDEVAARIVAGDGGPNRTFTQSLGLDGAGVTVAVADSGLNNGDAATMHPDLLGRVGPFFAYGGLPNAADQHGHGTHVAGIVAGNGQVGEIDDDGMLFGLGVAPGARIVAQRIFDAAGDYFPPTSFGHMTRDATQAGAEIGSNSWGDDSDGHYDTYAMEFDDLVRDADSTLPGDQAYIVEFSAGNAGPARQTIGTPAVAKNVIASGAAQNNRADLLLYDGGQEATADFSSRGPAEDGRIKPDVMAPGTWIASLQSFSATDENAWLPISDYYQYQGGTSQSGPHVSGAAAVFVQFYRLGHNNATPSPALVKAALINSAVDMDNSVDTAPAPNFDEGWGRVDLTRLISSSRSVEMVEQTNRLQAGQFYEQQVVVDDPGEPLKITLVYTDVPGFPGAIPVLVNDLDLEVTAPGGEIYRGNQFVEGESAIGATSADALNNVEGVHVAEPEPGIYRVVVRARRVAQDAIDATGEADQDFALVMSGHFLPPGLSGVVFNRAFYTAPDRVRVTVLDTDLSVAATPVVHVWSETEAGGEALILRSTGVPGVFTNSLATVAGGSASGDGRLGVSHGNVLQVSYVDAAPPGTRLARAEADLRPPMITNTTYAERFGRAIIGWETDELANSRVTVGTNTVQVQVRTNRLFTRTHEVVLDTLEPGLTYYYQVSSSDRAGNTATNNQGTVWLSFTAPLVPPILVVDAFYDDFLFQPPPIENYTDPLDQLGVEYEVWDKLAEGSPTAGDLQAFRAVLWRLPEANFFSQPTWTTAEQQALRQYLSQGGALFVASMEVLTRLDEVGASDFRQEVLHVSSYETDTSVGVVEGRPDDIIADGLDIELDYSTDYFEVDISDNITPAVDAEGILEDTFTGQWAGLRYPRTGGVGAGRVVFFSFPLDAIPATGPSPNNRVEVMRRVLNFLAPGLNGQGVISFDRNRYGLPDQVVVNLADSDLARQGTVEVHIFSSSDPQGLTVVLSETARFGIFRGTVTTFAGPSSLEGGRLHAAEGDVVWAQYHDVSLNQTVEVAAHIDTVAPTLLGEVRHEAGYVEAKISWITSEPTDALVQYGESLQFPINRTAYAAELASSHTVTVSGLQPDRVYYYQVVSHDEAGNVVVDDNNDEYYSFRTLRPLSPPWSDDLEGGTSGWDVVAGEETEAVWELGQPANRLATQAPSPVNAWGSNLRGASIGYAETYLISPAIHLAEGSQATLHFTQRYEFKDSGPLDVYEYGFLMIYTNTLSEPIVLRTNEGANGGWRLESVNLTPYLGNVVYLVWGYFLFTLGNSDRPGWMIDDVSVTVSGGTSLGLTISNNLAQGTWTLSGTLTRSGSGWLTHIPDAPSGDYTVTFGDVPYYTRPAAQSGTLTNGGSLLLRGQYTFIDANSNGMSDAWELAQFQEVSPARTAQTDSDQDGMTDREEFLAGTDPTAATSLLLMTLPTVMPNGQVRLEWQAMAGRAYQVQGSADGLQWQPIASWMQGSGGTASYLLPAPSPGTPFLFRVEVSP